VIGDDDGKPHVPEGPDDLLHVVDSDRIDSAEGLVERQRALGR
jgi:hypothetical protein